MPRKIGFREAGHIEIDGRRCLPFLWFRFSSEQTTKTRGLKLYRESILNNFVSCTLAAPWTERDLVEQIARQSEKRIPIESLPSDLSRDVFPRGRTVFGFPGDYFDQIARNYDNMWWWVSAGGVKMETLASTGPRISEFDKLAGRLMSEARLERLSNGRLPAAQYLEIATDLDKAQFKPVDHLEGRDRKKLAEWNQKHPREAIHSFCRAIEGPPRRTTLLFLRRAVHRRLNRAESCWEKVSNCPPAKRGQFSTSLLNPL
jgi:hypothetical protein